MTSAIQVRFRFPRGVIDGDQAGRSRACPEPRRGDDSARERMPYQPQTWNEQLE
jgi:hypothetical protein